jgi:hypothetical protein
VKNTDFSAVLTFDSGDDTQKAELFIASARGISNPTLYEPMEINVNEMNEHIKILSGDYNFLKRQISI